jgi:hypothetical protein
VRAADAGASEAQIMAMFGWEAAKQVAIYTRRRNRLKLEAEAADTLLRDISDDGIPAPASIIGGTV